MTYHELKIASYLYTIFSNDDKNYEAISTKNLNLNNRENVQELLDFLRKWGCRQFKVANNNISSVNIQKWYSKYADKLPKQNQHLIDTSDEKIKMYAELFDDLMNRKASVKNYETKDVDTKVGPVGTAKILLALRKNFFPPWDNPIIKGLNLTKDGKGYCNYLIYIKETLLEIKKSLNKKDFDNLPTQLGREHSGLPKLIDEYLWVSITRKLEPKEIIKLI